MTVRDKLLALKVPFRQIAQRAGLSEQGLSDLLAGRRDDPRLSTVARLHYATGGVVTFFDFVDPEIEHEVKVLKAQYAKPARRGRPRKLNAVE